MAVETPLYQSAVGTGLFQGGKALSAGANLVGPGVAGSLRAAPSLLGFGNAPGNTVMQGVKQGVNAGVDTGVNLGTHPGVKQGVNAGFNPGANSGVDAGVYNLVNPGGVGESAEQYPNPPDDQYRMPKDILGSSAQSKFIGQPAEEEPYQGSQYGSQYGFGHSSQSPFVAYPLQNFSPQSIPLPMYRNSESGNPRYLHTPNMGSDILQSGAGHDGLLGNIGNMRPVPSFTESGRAAMNYKATGSVNPVDELNGRVGEQDSPYQADPGVISLHDPQSPFATQQPRNFTTQSIPFDASGSRIAGRNYPGTPDAGANAVWFAPRTAGQEARGVLGYDPHFFDTSNSNVEDAGQKFQEPPVTLKSLAPAAFPSRGTPVSNIYGWTEYR